MGQPFGLDYAAVLNTARARGADEALVAELLPPIEQMIVSTLLKDTDHDDQDG